MRLSPCNPPRSWSDQDKERLVAEYPEGDVSALARSLGRSVNSVIQMAFKIGVVRKFPKGRKGVVQPVVQKKDFPATRKCTQCGKFKCLDQFSPLKNGKYGRHSFCKECMNRKVCDVCRRQRLNLDLPYVAQLLGMKPRDVPDGLYLLKKQHLIVLRELEVMKNENS